MKFAINSQELQKVLSRVIGVVPSKTTIPILENVLFELLGKKLNITATDLDMAMSVSLEVSGIKDGKVALPAKRIFETIRALPPTNVDFSMDSNFKITLKTNNGEYKLTGESSVDYPSIPSFKSETEIDMSADILKGLINKASFAVSNDELRPAMTGVLFHIKDKELRTVATDGHRLVRLITKGLSLPKNLVEILVPSKSLNLALKSIDGNTKVSFDEKHINFNFGNGILYSKLIDEQYPNYEAVIPLDYAKKSVVDRAQLLSSVRRVSLYSSYTTHQVRFVFSKNQLVVFAQDFEVGGEAKESIPCEYEGEDIEIGFNSNYVVDVLSHLESENVQIEFDTSIKAAIFREVESKENEDVLMIVMPVRLNN
jgi:DNA polymerase-3 subunit beta